jgi:hypothetical protein
MHGKKGIKGRVKVLYPLLKHTPDSCLFFFLQVKASAETLHATGGIKYALLSSKEWVTIGTDINLQNRLDAFCLKAVATSTCYCGFYVIWMYSFFHGLSQISTVMASSRGGQRRIRICTCVLLTYTSITTMQSDCTWMTSLRQDAYAGLLPICKVQQQLS